MNGVGSKADVLNTTPAYSYPWTPDQGDGTYRNPVLYADYSDPDAIRDGNDFWMTASSFHCTPGLPILHSRDLVNWTLKNHALKNLPGKHYDQVQPGCGVWAPSIRVHAGNFWIFFSTPDEGIFVTTADDPSGQWSEPHLLQAGKGLIDPCPLWDDDGKVYLVHAYAHSRSGLKHQLRVVPMSADGKHLLGDGQIVFHEPERHHTIEGPKFLKRDGWYYILAPAGGVATGWQTVLRSRNIFGPYEDRIVLHQGGTPVNGPHQGALLDTPNGDWWFLHFQDTGLYGRVVHLQPVKWREGWPFMGALNGNLAAGEPVLHHAKPNLSDGQIIVPATSDEFSSSKLGLQWQWQANHPENWHSLSARDGWLRLFAQPDSNDLARTPNLLLQKFPARTFAAETLIDLRTLTGETEAGFVVMGQKHTALAVKRNGSSCRIILRRSNAAVRVESEPLPLESAVRFLVRVRDGGSCEFFYSLGKNEFTAIEYSFQAQPGVWIGAKVGIYSLVNPGGGNLYADFDYFRFSPLRD